MAQALVADVAGEFGGKVQVVAHDVFEMNARDVRVGEQRHQRGLAFVVLVLGDAAVVHRIFQTESREHLALRETKPFSNRAQLTCHALWPRARIPHQELPPDEPHAARESQSQRSIEQKTFRLRKLPDGSSMRSLSMSAASLVLTCSPALLITRYCGSLSCAFCRSRIFKDESS